MALGEQQPMIQIQVDQRLALESAVHGEVEDTSVSTEITQFDKVGDSYILEGVLAFAGNLQESARSTALAGQKAPFEYSLPFALRIPVEGQPDYLKVNTRIRDWKLEHVKPGSLNFQAELTILGLTGNRGYYFYCGDQEDWVQPVRDEETAEFRGDSAVEAAIPDEETADSALAVEVEGLRSAAEIEQSYDEQAWMIESPVEKDEQDTLIYQPGWQDELQSAMAGNLVREEADEGRSVETAEDEFQFEALADEVVSAKAAVETAPPPALATVTAEDTDEESVQAAVASVQEVDQPTAKETEPEMVTAGQAAAETAGDTDEEVSEAAADIQAAQETELTEAKTEGPKLSFGKAKEEISPVKLSGLLYGSVTEKERRESSSSPEPASKAEAANESSEEMESTAALMDDQTTAEIEEPAVDLDSEQDSASPSIWGKWIQTDSGLTYSIKFRIVQEEETLQELANGYNTPIESLMRANGLTNENIDAGQVLLIPGRR